MIAVLLNQPFKHVSLPFFCGYFYIIGEGCKGCACCCRFVSDYGPEGYNCVCQHRLLQALQRLSVGPGCVRTYPPCLLEWTANRKRANTVLHIYCFDGDYTHTHTHTSILICLCTSLLTCSIFFLLQGCHSCVQYIPGRQEKKWPKTFYSTGIIFIVPYFDQLSHEFVNCPLFFVCRGVLEGRRGWTVLLKETAQWVELEGSDYVLDLMSDLELPADFPKRSSYFIISAQEPTRVRPNASMWDTNTL